MKQLGYYAKDKDNNLFQYEWGADDEFHILNSDGDLVMRDPKEYEVLQLGIITADDFNTTKQNSGELNSDARQFYNIILVHVSRTWERIRMQQVNQEMPCDNIASTDAIEFIADTIFDNKIIQGFVTGSEEVKEDDYWIKNTEEGMSDIFIEALADRIIIEGWIEPQKPKVRKWEQINDGVELNEDFLPSSNLTYSIAFDGIDKFKATLEQDNFDRKMVGVETAPKTIHYKLNKPVEEFTIEEKKQILSYRGLELSDGFGVDDIFIEKSFITLVGVDVLIEMNVHHTITFDRGESAEDLLNRSGDILFSGNDLGGNTNIEFI